MKHVTFQRLSIVEILLIGVSAIITAVVPKNESKKSTAKLQASLGPNNTLQRTCTMTDYSGLSNCHYTPNAVNPGIGSRTTTAGSYGATSSITTINGINKVKTITDVAGRHSSKSPN